jgi:hypothetical protein
VLIGQGRVHEARPIIDKRLEETADADDVQFRGDDLMRAGEFAELEARWDDTRDLLAQGIAKGKAGRLERRHVGGADTAVDEEGRRGDE